MSSSANAAAAAALRARLQQQKKRKHTAPAAPAAAVDGAKQPAERKAAAAAREEVVVDGLGFDGRRVAPLMRAAAAARPDDDVRVLAQRERVLGAGGDQDRQLAMRVVRAGAADLEEMSEQLAPDGAAAPPRKKKKKHQQQQQQTAEEAMRQREISEYNRAARVLDSCWLCSKSAKCLQHLVVSTGLSTYMSVPSRHHLTPGHCCLTTREHVVSCVEMAENVYEELRFFQKQIALMFKRTGNRGVVFVETVVEPKRRQRHTQVHCVPLSAEEMAEAPVYFKQAMLAAGPEHQATREKLIDCTAKPGGVRQTVPSGFGYVHVEFGVGGLSLVHVIEDSRLVSDTFGLSVLCGILGEPPQLVLRNARAPRAVEEARARDMREMWKRFDWTAKLLQNQKKKKE